MNHETEHEHDNGQIGGAGEFLGDSQIGAPQLVAHVDYLVWIIWRRPRFR